MIVAVLKIQCSFEFAVFISLFPISIVAKFEGRKKTESQIYQVHGKLEEPSCLK